MPRVFRSEYRKRDQYVINWIIAINCAKQRILRLTVNFRVLLPFYFWFNIEVNIKHLVSQYRRMTIIMHYTVTYRNMCQIDATILMYNL